MSRFWGAVLILAGCVGLVLALVTARRMTVTQVKSVRYIHDLQTDVCYVYLAPPSNWMFTYGDERLLSVPCTAKVLVLAEPLSVARILGAP